MYRKIEFFEGLECVCLEAHLNGTDLRIIQVLSENVKHLSALDPTQTDILNAKLQC